MEVPFFPLGILLRVSQRMRFFLKFKGTWKESNLLCPYKCIIVEDDHTGWQRGFPSCQLHGQLSVEDPCNQKLFPAIISELWEERDNGDATSSDRPGFMQRRIESCPSAGVAHCGSAPEITVTNTPVRV